MMPRTRGSGTAWRTSPRTSPALARSRGSFFARIFVFFAMLGGPETRSTTDAGVGEDSGTIGDVTRFAAFGWGFGRGACAQFMPTPPPPAAESNYSAPASSCTTSQYLKDGSCVACPPSTGAASSHPSATSTGGSATSCTCPENYYAYAGMYAPSMYNWACAECGVGSGFIKNGSAIPTADGASDTCDCPAGYYLDNTGLNCNECPAGQTSAGGRVTECYSAPASSCTTSQYLKDGACVACPPSTGVSSSHPSATSTGGSATFCTCPENYYAFPGIDAPSTYDWACAECPGGSNMVKNGSAIPTASSDSDPCDCPAGYRLEYDGLSCVECPAGQTSAGGRVTECYSAPASSCTTSQYLKDGACVACPSSQNSDPTDPTTPPSSTSTGEDATYCTCPNDYYADADANPGEWLCRDCSGDNFEKNGSAIPTESGNSDTCDCKAGYYLSADVTGLLGCNECPAGQTSAGGRVTECTSSSSDGSPSPSDSCSSSRATGGTVTTDGDYTIHTFTSSHTFAVVDSTLNEVDVLVVGGGGGGSSESGGGGGGRSCLSQCQKRHHTIV